MILPGNRAQKSAALQPLNDQLKQDNARGSSRIVRWIAWGSFLAALIFAMRHHLSEGGLNDVYVSPEGSDWNRGESKDAPVKSIARGLELVAESGTVHLLPGVYVERCHLNRGGTAEKPLRFAAEIPGTVTVTWKMEAEYCRGLRWTAHRETEGVTLYTTAVERPVYRLRRGEEELFRVPWGGRPALLGIAKLRGAHGAFCYETGVLSIFLPGGQHPQEAELVFHCPVPEPREWGEFRSANLWVEVDHIEIDGIHFEYGIGSAIRISGHKDVSIRDCVFSGATFGVSFAGTGSQCRQVRLERCLYHNYPQHSWRRDWLDWQEIYAAYASSTLVAGGVPDLQIRDCVAVHAGDAIRITNPSSEGTEQVIAEGNLLAYFTDDAVELDGPSRNVTFRRNLIVDGHESLGTSPVEEGPCLIEENVFVHPRVELNGAQIKLIGNTPDHRIQNIEVRQNLFLGNWLVWRNEIPISNVEVRENLFVVRRREEPLWPPGVNAAENTLIDLAPEPDSMSLRQAVTILKTQATKAFPGAGDILRERILHQYGPTWWNWDSHPATGELFEALKSAAEGL